MAMTTDELNERLWAGMVVFWEEQAKFWEKAEEIADYFVVMWCLLMLICGLGLGGIILLVLRP